MDIVSKRMRMDDCVNGMCLEATKKHAITHYARILEYSRQLLKRPALPTATMNQ